MIYLRFSLIFSWYTHNGPGPLPVLSGPRVRLLGPILAIEAVTSEDSGVYKCTASNVGGEASAELRLTVATPIQVEISPNILSVHMGGNAEFRCIVTSNGSPVGMQNILWYKDGRQLPSSGRIEDTLMVTRVSRENRGMYQCVVRRPEGDTFQATAELQLGGENTSEYLYSCLTFFFNEMYLYLFTVEITGLLNFYRRRCKYQHLAQLFR